MGMKLRIKLIFTFGFSRGAVMTVRRVAILNENAGERSGCVTDENARGR